MAAAALGVSLLSSNKTVLEVRKAKVRKSQSKKSRQYLLLSDDPQL